MKSNILFFDVCNPAYIPLVKAVHERGYPLVMNGCGLRDHLQETDVHLLPLESFVATDLSSYVQKTTIDVITNLVQALNKPGMNKAFSSPMGDFLPHTGKAFFEKLSSLIGPAIWAIEAFESLVSQCHVSLVVLGCDNSPTQRALVKAAGGFKIPTLHLPHGIPGKACYGVAGEIGDLYADFLAAYGEVHRVRLMENNVSRERIFLTGSPLWDPLYRDETSISKEEACSLLNLDPERPVVLYCTSYVDGSNPYFLGVCRELFDLHQAVLLAVSRLGPEVQFLVRPHPNEMGRSYYPEEDLEWLEQAYQSWSKTRHHVNVRLIRDKKIESIRAADLVITIPSNVISEAMILQRPVMALPLSSEEDGKMREEHQGAQVVRDKAQIYPMLKGLLESPSMREEIVKQQNIVLPDVNYGHDGEATYRVAALVEQLATSKLTISSPSPLSIQKPKPLRIVLAVHNFPPHGNAGTELYTYDVAKALQSRGHEVTVFYPVIAETPQDIGQVTLTSYDELPVARLELSQSQLGAVRNEKVKPTIRKYFLEHSVDVVHIQHLMGLSTSFVEVLEELNIPIVLTANDFWFLCQQIHLVEPNGMVCSGPETIDKCVRCYASRYGPFSEERIPDLFHYIADRLYACKETMKKVDLVLCPSLFLLKMFRSYGCESKKMIHAPQGANLFKPIEVSKQSQDSIVFSYLGNIAYRKGLDILIDAINRVDTSNAEFRIYGAVTEATYFGEIMQRVQKGKNVIFYGAYSPRDLPGILSQTHMAVIPSRGENYPFIIREVLHGGVPVIASSVAGIPEIVRDGENGLLFKGGSADELAEKIQKVIQSPHLIAQLKGNIQPIKSIEQDVIEFENYYASVMSSHSKSAQSPLIEMQKNPIAVNGIIQKNSDVQHANHSDEAVHREMFTASIIIPVFNKADLTKQCLTQLAIATGGVSYEVIVVDNASTDETAEFLSSLSGDIQVITNPENFGFAKACNQGAAAAKGKYLVFLNNDTIPKPGWLASLIHEVDSHKDVAVVGSKLLYPNNTIQHAGVAFSRYSQLPYHIFNGFPENWPEVNIRKEFQTVTAACMLVRKEVFEEVGAFDEGFVNGFEDVDLCLKIRQIGKKVVYQPKSCLYHLESQSPGRKKNDDLNAQRLATRWKFQWLVDEDIIADQSGLIIQYYFVGEQLKVRMIPKNDVSHPGSWQQVVELQRLLFQQKRLPLAEMTNGENIRKLLRDIDTWPSDIGILVWLGGACEALHCEEKAIQCWEKLLMIGDNSTARVRLARAEMKKGNCDEAQKHLDVLKHDFLMGAESWALQGILSIQRQNYSQAKDAFEQALDFDRGNRKARMGLGMAWMGLGENAKAWDVFEQMISEDPDNVKVIGCLIQAGTALQRWEALARHLTRFVERNPADCDIRFALAGVEFRAGYAGKANEQLTWLRLIKPDFEGLEDLEGLLHAAQSQDNLVSTH